MIIRSSEDILEKQKKKLWFNIAKVSSGEIPEKIQFKRQKIFCINKEHNSN